jgi:hypothetical protein
VTIPRPEQAIDDGRLVVAVHPQVTITFNGQDKVLDYQPHATTEALLAHAKLAFDVPSNHLLSLFTDAGIEVPDHVSVEQAGIHPGQLLILRQSTVRGGA